MRSWVALGVLSAGLALVFAVSASGRASIQSSASAEGSGQPAILNTPPAPRSPIFYEDLDDPSPELPEFQSRREKNLQQARVSSRAQRRSDGGAAALADEASRWRGGSRGCLVLVWSTVLRI